MIQRSEHLRFAFEARQAIGIKRKQFGQDLERNVAIQLRVMSAVHLAHRASPEDGNDFVRTYSLTRDERRMRLCRIQWFRYDARRFGMNPLFSPG